MRRLLPLMLCLCLLLSACGGNAPAAGSSTDLLEEVPPAPDPTPVSDPAPVPDLGQGWPVMFALGLLRESMTPGENTLVSPLSALAALGMTAQGAAGETAVQMARVLGASPETVRELMGAYREEDGVVHLANALWLRDDPGLTVEETFLAAVRDGYGAAAYKAPFDDATVADINAFVKTHTKDRIPKILDKLEPDTALCLVNALAFDGAWEEPYDAFQVGDWTFLTEDGVQRDIQIMHSTEWDYLEDEQATGFLKYYKGGRYAFAALLPREGLTVAEYVNALDWQALCGLLENPRHIKTYASLPQFKSECSLSLKEPLMALGMTDAFDRDRADFSNMGHTQDGGLYISQALQKTFLEVDGQGTQAAAATVVVVSPTCAMPEPEESRTVTLDRPFLYLLWDTETHTPLFLGTLMDIR